MNSIKLVTFDATNTILRFKMPPWQYYSVVARHYGYKVSEEILKDRMNDSFKLLNTKHPNFGRDDLNWEKWWRKLVELTFKDQLPSNAKIDEIATKLINEFRTPKCWIIADGSCQLLQFLRTKDAAVGVISNFDPRLKDILKNLDLINSFDFILTSYDIGFSKPDQRIFSSAIKACGKLVEPSQCLHIGDDVEKDYRAAKAAGWHALLIGPLQTGCEMPPAKEHVFSSIDKLNIAVQNNNVKL